MLQCLRKGDTLSSRTSTISRALKDLQDIVHELKSKGVTLKATEQPVDTSTGPGKAFSNMLGVVAHFRTNLRRERQMEEIAAAKEWRVYTGRRPRIDPGVGRRLYAESRSAPRQ